MKHSATQSAKFFRLKRRLGWPTYQVIGLLEGLWLFAAVNAQDGAIGRRHTDEDLLAWLEIPESPVCPVSALIEAGWLDRCPENRLIVHDWEEHCPRWIRGAMAKHGKQFARPKQTPETPQTPFEQPAKQTHMQPAKQNAEQPAKQYAPNLTKPNLTINTPHSPPYEGEPGQTLFADQPATPPKPKRARKTTPGWDPLTCPLPYGDAFAAVWPKWVKDRSDRKNPVTEGSADQLFSKAKREKWTEAEAVEAIENAILKGWSGPQKVQKWPERGQGATIYPKTGGTPATRDERAQAGHREATARVMAGGAASDLIRTALEALNHEP